LLSTLAAICELRSGVQDLFKDVKHGYVQKYNNYGVYFVNMFDNGVLKKVVVDDFIPCLEV
jgi:Calpain family cysteine protease